MTLPNTSTTRRISAIVHAPGVDQATKAAADFHRVLDSVWIAKDGFSVTHLTRDLYAINVRVQAPINELVADAPILGRAVRSTGYPTDTLCIDRG